MASPFLKEFKEFAVKGSVIDLAVGIVIGSSFQKIINSLVNDIIMPPVGMLLGRVDLSNRFISLSGADVSTVAEAKAKGIPTINYGLFINETISFLIVALALFLMVKTINRMRREKEKEDAKK